MRKSSLAWHMLAQPLASACILACSGQAREFPSDQQSLADGSKRGQDGAATERRSAQAVSLEPMPTTIRVINRSDRVRSRHTPCAGTYEIGVRPATLDRLPTLPTCNQVECASLGPSEVVPAESICAVPACEDGRVDVEPGGADADVTWDGVFWSLTERNCYVAQTFDIGTAMLASVCFGVPGESPWDITSLGCEDRPFEYGQSLVTIELEQ